jgi:short-subunit dehydrogenase
LGEISNRWARVTGASSGLGADFAQLLAERGCHVVLVARREDRLQKLSKEIENAHGVQTRVIPMSLSGEDARRELYERLAREGIEIDVLVNNAGFGVHGPFLEIPWEREHEMLELDIVALVHLTKLFVKDMVERNFGYVLQVASIGAYQPTPTYASYSAAKSFVLSFGEALHYELRHTHVKVTVLSPGVTATEFLHVSGQAPTLYQRIAMMPSRKVAESGLRAMLRGKPSRIPGLVNAIPAFSLRFMPRRAQAALAHWTMNTG